MATPHIIFKQPSFQGTSGASIASANPAHTEGPTPAYAVLGGSWAFDGDGNAVGQQYSTARVYGPMPADGQGDWSWAVSVPGGGGLTLYDDVPSTGAYAFYLSPHDGAISYINKATNATLAAAAFSMTGAMTATVSMRMVGGVLHFTCSINGTQVLSGTDSSPISPS